MFSQPRPHPPRPREHIPQLLDDLRPYNNLEVFHHPRSKSVQESPYQTHALGALKNLLIKHMFPQPTANPPGPGQHIPQFLDGLHLLLHKLALQEVGEVAVAAGRGKRVQVQDGLEGKTRKEL